MTTPYEITGEHSSGSHEHIAFTFTRGDMSLPGFVSEGALKALGGAEDRDALWIFVENRNAIAKAALAFWARNPQAQHIILDTGNF